MKLPPLTPSRARNDFSSFSSFVTTPSFQKNKMDKDKNDDLLKKIYARYPNLKDEGTLGSANSLDAVIKSGVFPDDRAVDTNWLNSTITNSTITNSTITNSTTGTWSNINTNTPSLTVADIAKMVEEIRKNNPNIPPLSGETLDQAIRTRVIEATDTSPLTALPFRISFKNSWDNAWNSQSVNTKELMRSLAPPYEEFTDWYEKMEIEPEEYRRTVTRIEDYNPQSSFRFLLPKSPIEFLWRIGYNYRRSLHNLSTVVDYSDIDTIPDDELATTSLACHISNMDLLPALALRPAEPESPAYIRLQADVLTPQIPWHPFFHTLRNREDTSQALMYDLRQLMFQLSPESRGILYFYTLVTRGVYSPKLPLSEDMISGIYKSGERLNALACMADEIDTSTYPDLDDAMRILAKIHQDLEFQVLSSTENWTLYTNYHKLREDIVYRSFVIGSRLLLPYSFIGMSMTLLDVEEYDAMWCYSYTLLSPKIKSRMREHFLA